MATSDSDTGDERLARLLNEVLERAGAGEHVTPAWLRENYGDDAPALMEILDLDALLSTPPVSVGQHLGPCRLLHELGSGGMGTVYLAELIEPYGDLERGRRVAIKVIHPYLAGSARVQSRFMTETVVSTRVNHPNVVSTLASLRVPVSGAPVLCLLMEPVDGVTLAEYRPKGEVAPEALCHFVATEVAKALAAVHELGIVHRDVKPHNVMISGEHRVILMDLGVAQVAMDEGVFVGSPRYAAPEQLDPDVSIDARADLYSLGLTLVELALGDRPGAGPPYELPEAYSPFFVAVVRCLTQPDREQRFSTARELSEVLERGEHSDWWAQQRDGNVRLPAADAATSRVHGRGPELETLDGALEQARQNAGQVHVVVGPAGIGKSRLIREFVTRHEDVAVAKSGYDPKQISVSLSGVPQVLRELPELAEAVEALPGTMAAAIRGWLGGEQPHRENVEADALAHALAGLCVGTPEPLILWIDDVHLAPEHHLTVLEAIGKRVSTAAVLLIASGRPGSWVDSIGTASHSEDLGPLTETALVALVEDAAHPRRLANSLIETIVERAAGSPLFALSIFWALSNELVRREDGSWAAPPHIRMEVPRGLDDVLRRRLTGLSNGRRRVLEAAACVGVSFDGAPVAAALDRPPGDVQADLDHLFALPGVIVAHESGYRFDHHCLNELVHRETPPAIRATMHRALAQFFSADASSDEDNVRVCTHAVLGASPELARPRIEPALKYLLSAHQVVRTIELARAACDVPGLLEGTIRLDVLSIRFEALYRWSSEGAELRSVLQEWEELALAEPDFRREVEFRLSYGQYHFIRTAEYAKVEEQARLGLECLDRNEDDPALRARLLRLRSSALSGGSKFAEALDVGREAVRLAERSGDIEVRFFAAATLARAAFVCKTEDFAEIMHTCIDLSKEVDAPQHRVYPNGMLGMWYGNLFEWERALACFDEGEAAALEVGDLRSVGIIRSRRGETHWTMGRYREAEVQTRAGLSYCMDIDDRFEAAVQFFILARIQHDCGDFAAARASLERSLELAQTIKDRHREAEARVWLAVVEIGNGDLTIGREHVNAAAPVLKEVGIKDAACYALQRCGEAAVFRFGREVGRRLFHEARQQEGTDLSYLFIDLWLAALDNGDAASNEARVKRTLTNQGAHNLILAPYLLWCLGEDPRRLEQSRRRLEELVAHAPDEAQDTMIDALPLYAAIRDGRPLPP